MAPPARLLGSLEATASQVSAARYVCLTCRRQSLPYRSRIVIHHAQRLNSTNSSSWFDKLQPTSWKKGTSKPESQREAREGEQDATPAPPPNTEYVPAKTWDGLKRVGFERKSWEDEETREFEFEPFVPSQQLRSRHELERALHRTAVELTMMRDTKRPMSDIYKSYEEGYLALLDQVTVKATQNLTRPTLIFPNDEVKRQLYEIFRRAAVEEESSSTSEFTKDLPDAPGFLSLSLEADEEFKFHLLKRASQLTGHRVPDCEISKITSPSALLKHMIDASKPKPKKLAEELLSNEKIASLPNIKVAKRKPSFVEQETEIGRWKVIEAELDKRGLPHELTRNRSGKPKIKTPDP